MTNRLEATILINRPAEDVFAFLNIPENHPKFVPGMLEFKKTSPGPLGQVGATIRGVRQFLGQRMELPYEITEYEPGNRLGMKGAMARSPSKMVMYWTPWGTAPVSSSGLN